MLQGNLQKETVNLWQVIPTENDVAIKRMQDGLLSNHASLAMLGCLE